MDSQTLDLERQNQAKEYARIRRKFMLLDLCLGIVILFLWILSGLSVQLRDLALNWSGYPWVAVLIYGGIFGLTFTLLDLPLSYHTGYTLPHRFQQSTQTIKGWWGDFAKSMLLSGLLGGIVLEVIYLLLRSSPDAWWLWAGGFLLLFNVLLTNLAPILLFPIFYKFTPLDNEFSDLQNRLLKLVEESGTKVRGVYKFDMSKRTKSANAGLTGLGKTRRIILGDTLLNEFSPDEIETILAHELGHQINQDIPLGILFQSVLTMGGLYLTSLGLTWGITRSGYKSISDIAALPLFALFLGAFGLITMPLNNGFSRWRERMADQVALQLTGNGPAYASALIRLSNQNLAEVDPEPWVEFLLYSHPALAKRIRRAENHHKNPGD